MDIFAIAGEFRRMAGMSAIEAAEWLPLCASAAVAINARLKEDAFCDDTAPLIHNAVAAMAFQNYMLTCAAGSDSGSFRAGDVSIAEDKSQSMIASQKLLETALEAISPFMRDEKFCFKQVCDG